MNYWNCLSWQNLFSVGELNPSHKFSAPLFGEFKAVLFGTYYCFPITVGEFGAIV
jgi:hypothetical protein